ncbi:aminopeptidase P family protein [Neokomagataea anthophila]|uniref:Aminopeptidase P family protein n=1 Tax=Neokomagataea anthophila TaxID=2826925 RepID=A0ABS5E6X8_9PROT|nr:aminopeptidase P family protein [Neokomagataea anthophila]MBR0559663.1 aminopeptidase P family protein [Neokomagataea anthophila]
MTFALSPSERIAAVRAACSAASVDGFILPRGDEFLGEYVAPYAERLAWLSGFTGSAGLAIVLPGKAGLFSDGRYTVQMEQQAQHDVWSRCHIIEHPPAAWLAEHAQGLCVGYDPKLVSRAMLNAWTTPGVTFVPLASNPVDQAWADQPQAPQSVVFPQSDADAGQSSEEKRHQIAAQLQKDGHDAVILADCTSLAWLLNIRGDDVPLTPVAQGYAVLRSDAHVELFIAPERLEAGLAQALGDEVSVRSPKELAMSLAELGGNVVRIDPATTPVWFETVLVAHGAEIDHASDPCTLPKAIKNSVEQEGSRRAHALDAIAVTRFLYSLTQSAAGKHETELSDRLNSFREQHADYRGQSFDAISASGPNAAFPHYKAEVGRDSVLPANSVYLIDSGGQYPFGTTDITRTVWIGPERPSDAAKEAFTRVLKGNIALSLARFPTGTPGYRLDALARASLWDIGLDYDHGTGHGIGNYLSVHEGPQNISPAPRPTGLVNGMIVSNEPGYYEQGAFGIRIENLLLVKDVQLSAKAKRPFSEFEVLTYVPIDRALIESSLLDDREQAWLNAYHQEVLKRVGPSLDGDERAWLEVACQPVKAG